MNLRNFLKKPRNEVELKNQIALVEYLRLHKDKPLFHKNDNEGKRSRILGAKLKLAGLVPGVPDLFICEPRGIYHGLYIEVKANEKSKVSINQRLFIDALRNRGYMADVCYTVDQGIMLISNYLSLHKHT